MKCRFEQHFPISACFLDGTLRPTALPQNPSLWSPSANLNITITGVSHDQEILLRLAFDQALTVAIAMNHELGYKTLKRAFTSASSSSSSFQCCMCLWALAYLNAPNINRNTSTGDRLAAAQEMGLQASKAGCLQIESSLERDLLSAMVARFPADRNDTNGAGFDEAFAKRMGGIIAGPINNPLAQADIALFYAEAAMNLWAWNYYKDPVGRVNLRDEVKRAAWLLDGALKIVPNHPFALHFTIHLYEASVNLSFIESAIVAGSRLKTLIPINLSTGIGHLIHMPAHSNIRSLNGLYHEAVLANQKAIKDDSNYFIACAVPKQDYYRQHYFTHKHAFLGWAAMLSGESEKAIDAANRLHTDCDIVTIAENQGGLFVSYPSWKLQVLLKFGRFKEVIETPPPEQKNNINLDAYISALFFMTRSVALASLGRCNEASKERIRFLKLSNNRELRNVAMFMIKTGDLLDMAKHFMTGRVSRLCQGYLPNVSESEELRAAVKIQDSFPYNEPPYWPDSVRVCLGAALLHEGKANEALAVFEEDLSASWYPRNGWSLKGKELALRNLSREEDAEQVAEEFGKAWKFADVELKLPCI